MMPELIMQAVRFMGIPDGRMGWGGKGREAKEVKRSEGSEEKRRK
jgi:hypothetical protein